MIQRIIKEMKKVILTICLGWFLAFGTLVSQNLDSRSNTFDLNATGAKDAKDTSVPIIKWIEPANETVFLQEDRLHVKFDIYSPTVIKEVNLSIREKEGAASRGSETIIPKDDQKNHLVLEKNVFFPEGVNVLELTVENMDGVKATSFRTIHKGQTALADAARLNRHDYALIFVTDKYDNWSSLVNPVFDGRTIGAELRDHYGFETEIIENPSQESVFTKLREYSERKYQPLDELLIFFAGHGYYDETFKEGYVVVKESLRNDPGKTSYVSYNRLRSVINVVPCEHIFLMMDVCFGGTFDESLASRGDEIYEDVSQSEYIMRKLSGKTRKYLTSGGKTYVSDGVAGQHSPFAKRVLDALDSYGGNDGILTTMELYPFVEKLNPEPILGRFGDDTPGSEFVFVVK